jgi:hypothetical protein
MEATCATRQNAGRRRIVVVVGVVAAAATAGLALTAAPATGAPFDPCEAAAVLAGAHQLDAAVAEYAAAAKQALPCGTGAGAQRALADKARAHASYFTGRAREETGDQVGAADAYRAALDLNAQNADASGALLRLTGAPDPSAAPADPFAGAKALAKAGRTTEARAATIEAIKASGRQPTAGEIREILAGSRLDRWRTWLDKWWPEVALALLVVIILWTRLKMQPAMRRASARPLVRALWPRLRLAVATTNASGLEPDLSSTFSARLRQEIGDQQSAMVRDDPRFVVGTDAGVDLPDFGQAPVQAQFLVELWRWLSRQNIVTLQVTLLPAGPGGVCCHVSLTEASGATVRGIPSSHRTIHRKPRDWKWPLPEGTTLTADAWQQLVPLVTAWGMFATRAVQTSSNRLQHEVGTADTTAYGLFLAGLEDLGQPEVARVSLEQAVERDSGFREAHLNLAYCESVSSEPDDWDEAEERLRTHVLANMPGIVKLEAGPLDYATGKRARHRALWYRARYSLAVIRMNRLSASLSDATETAATTRDELERIEREVAELRKRIEHAIDASQKRSRRDDPLLEFLRDISAHVDLVYAGVLDLHAKYSALASASGGVAALPGLPVDLATASARSDEQRVAVGIIARYSKGTWPAYIEYALACIWARDARLRSSDTAAAITHAGEHLRRAIRKDATLEARWQRDPDLAPVAGQLGEWLRVKDRTREDAATPKQQEPSPVPLAESA